MGLDASVRCNCFELGLTKPPPVPREAIRLDENGWLYLDSPLRDDNQVQRAFYAWLSADDTCQHALDYASVRVSNWSGYRLFQEALGRAGWDHFPVLREQLPNSNDGSMPASLAPAALSELEYFEEEADLGTSMLLVDSDNGETLRESVDSYDGQFIWDGKAGLEIGFDEHGLWIRTSAKPPTIMFRSKSFEQRLLEPERTDSDGSGRVEYVDSGTGYSFVCTSAISGEPISWPDGKMEDGRGRMRFQYPRRMYVERRRVTADNFAYILQPLREVFQAAIATSNPVRWS